MPDLVPYHRGVDPASVVRALKGDRELNKNFPGDYSVGDQWYSYGPSHSTPDFNLSVYPPTAADMNKDPSAPTPPPSPMINPRTLGWNRVADGMFGVPAQRLQQMAGDLLPFPKLRENLINSESLLDAAKRVKGEDTKNLLNDVLGVPSNVVPFPAPPTPIG